MASTVESKIREVAPRNAELLQILADTDSAIPDCANHVQFIKDLEKEYHDIQSRIRQATRSREKESADHAKYRDSVMRRFAFKVSGNREKFDERAKKEEEEYFQALQVETQQKEMFKNLEEQLNEAKRVRRELEVKAEQNRSAQEALDNIYHGIFKGPTPGFPEEDAREGDVAAALRVYQETRQITETKSQAVRHMKEATLQLATAKRSMQEALSASRHDMFGGGSMWDMMERNALHKAEMAIATARTSVIQAQALMPEVRDLPVVDIAHGNLMSDVFFDNIFTDMAFHDKIHASVAMVDKCDKALNQEVQLALGRENDYRQNLATKEKNLQVARQALQKARQDAFERVLSGGASQPQDARLPEAPPAYAA